MNQQFIESKLKLEHIFNKDRQKNFFCLKILVKQGGMGDVATVLIEDIEGREQEQFRLLTRQLACHLNDTLVWTQGSRKYQIVSLQVPDDGRNYLPFLSGILSTGNDVINCSPDMVYILEPLKRTVGSVSAVQHVKEDPMDDPERPIRKGMGMFPPPQQKKGNQSGNRFDQLKGQEPESLLVPMFLPVTQGVNARNLVTLKETKEAKEENNSYTDLRRKKPVRKTEEEEDC